MYNYKQIANYFIGKAIEGGTELTPLKLQKLLFFAYGIYLAINKKPLFSERFSAWKYGPVISQLYFQLKSYGSRNIDRKLTDFDLGTFEEVIPEVDRKDKALVKFLDDFWNTYKDYTAVQLSNATHLLDTPWDKALKRTDPVIDDGEMQEYFSKWVKQ